MKFKNASDSPVSVSSLMGNARCFAPGETLDVSEDLERACFDARLALIADSVAVPVEQTGPSNTDRATLIKDAVAILVARGDPKDFTADGRVRKSAVDASLKFKSTSDELGTAYAAVLAGK